MRSSGTTLTASNGTQVRSSGRFHVLATVGSGPLRISASAVASKEAPAMVRVTGAGSVVDRLTRKRLRRGPVEHRSDVDERSAAVGRRPDHRTFLGDAERRAMGALRRAEELVGAERARLDGPPCGVSHRGSLVPGTDSVAPVVAGGEVPTGMAHRPHVEAAGGVEDVGAVAGGVGMGARGFVDPLVHRPTHVLEEPPEHPAIHLGNSHRRVPPELCEFGPHGSGSLPMVACPQARAFPFFEGVGAFFITNRWSSTRRKRSKELTMPVTRVPASPSPSTTTTWCRPWLRMILAAT